MSFPCYGANLELERIAWEEASELPQQQRHLVAKLSCGLSRNPLAGSGGSLRAMGSYSEALLQPLSASFD